MQFLIQFTIYKPVPKDLNSTDWVSASDMAALRVSNIIDTFDTEP